MSPLNGPGRQKGRPDPGRPFFVDGPGCPKSRFSALDGSSDQFGDLAAVARIDRPVSVERERV